MLTNIIISVYGVLIVYLVDVLCEMFRNCLKILMKIWNLFYILIRK